MNDNNGSDSFWESDDIEDINGAMSRIMSEKQVETDILVLGNDVAGQLAADRAFTRALECIMVLNKMASAEADLEVNDVEIQIAVARSLAKYLRTRGAVQAWDYLVDQEGEGVIITNEYIRGQAPACSGFDSPIKPLSEAKVNELLGQEE